LRPGAVSLITSDADDMKALIARDERPTAVLTVQV